MTTTKTDNLLLAYYSNRDVQSRLLEFLGGDDVENATAKFITSEGAGADVSYRPHPPRHLWRCLEQQCEVGRSLWDSESLIIDLDIEYVNSDQPARSFVQPKDSYHLQEPVVATLQSWLNKHGLAPLHWISGQGHHFIWRISRSSEAFDKLVDLGHLTESLRVRYQSPAYEGSDSIGWELGLAFSGLGIP